MNALDAGDSVDIVGACARMIAGYGQHKAVLMRFQDRFVNGMVSCKRFLEVLMLPFVRLSEFINQRTAQRNQNHQILALTICSSLFSLSTYALEIPMILPASRRADLMAALFEARIPQVTHSHYGV